MDGGRLDLGHVQYDVQEKNTVGKGRVDATIQGYAPLLGKPRHAGTIHLVIRLENQWNLLLRSKLMPPPFPGKIHIQIETKRYLVSI